MIAARALDLRAHWVAGKETIQLVRDRRPLLMAMTWREMTDRYAGQALGVAWVAFSPLLMISTYLLAFSLIFKGRIGIEDDGSTYVAFLLAGLVPWMTMQDCLSRATTSVTGHGNLVKQIVFPSEILPLRVALACLPILGIGTLVTLPVVIWSGHGSVVGLLVLLPLIIVFFVIFLAGMSMWLAALGVFSRDIKDVITFFLGVGLFLHPILYPPESVPQWLSPVFVASPLSHMIWCFRDALGLPHSGSMWSWIVFPVVSILIFTTGWRSFRMLKPTFGNVL